MVTKKTHFFLIIIATLFLLGNATASRKSKANRNRKSTGQKTGLRLSVGTPKKDLQRLRNFIPDSSDSDDDGCDSTSSSETESSSEEDSSEEENKKIDFQKEIDAYKNDRSCTINKNFGKLLTGGGAKILKQHFESETSFDDQKENEKESTEFDLDRFLTEKNSIADDLEKEFEMLKKMSAQLEGKESKNSDSEL